MDVRLEVCTVGEAAKLLRVSVATVRRLIVAGELKAVRIGRSIRIERRVIERFVAAGGVR